MSDKHSGVLKMIRYIAVLLVTLSSVACGGSSSTSPSPVTTPTTTASLSGNVTVTNTSVRVIGITITLLDGPNAGRTTTTDSQGQYRFESLTSGNTNVSATAAGWEEVRSGAVVTGSTTLNFITKTIQPWGVNGSGNNVFDKPVWVSRTRITGAFGGNSSNFVVWCDSTLVVNELLGTFWGRLSYSGTHATDSCRQIRIENSSGVVWGLSEVR